MRLESKIKLLNHAQVYELHDRLVEAGISYELTGKFKDVFRRAKYRKVGAERKVYEYLEAIPAKALPEIINIVTG